MFIPLFSPTIQRSEMDAVLTCLVDEKVGPGEMASRLEKKVCETFGVPFALALRSPALALDFALKLLNLQQNTPVIISALAPSWHYQQVVRSGFTPVVLDVDRKTALMETAMIEQAVKEGARALVLHNTLGNVPKYEDFSELGIPIIEDISQSAGSYYTNSEIIDPIKAIEYSCKKDSADAANENAAQDEKAETGTTTNEAAVLKRAGTFCTFTILGLEEKDALTAGGGAVLFVSDKRSVPPLKQLAAEIPSTDKLPDINAALGFVQLKNLKKNMEARLEIEKIYKRAVMSGKHGLFSFLPNVIPAVYNFAVVLERGYKDAEKYANKKKVEVALAFTDTVAYALADKLTDCENAKALILRTALFPLYPRLGVKKAETVSKILSTLP